MAFENRRRLTVSTRPTRSRWAGNRTCSRWRSTSAAGRVRHRAILRALPDWVFLMSTDGVFLDCHVKTEYLAGPEAFIGRHVTDVLPELAPTSASVRSGRGWINRGRSSARAVDGRDPLLRSACGSLQ
jgi:PAS domain-containing protein